MASADEAYGGIAPMDFNAFLTRMNSDGARDLVRSINTSVSLPSLSATPCARTRPARPVALMGACVQVQRTHTRRRAAHRERERRSEGGSASGKGAAAAPSRARNAPSSSVLTSLLLLPPPATPQQQLHARPAREGT